MRIAMSIGPFVWEKSWGRGWRVVGVRIRLSATAYLGLPCTRNLGGAWVRNTDQCRAAFSFFVSSSGAAVSTPVTAPLTSPVRSAPTMLVFFTSGGFSGVSPGMALLLAARTLLLRGGSGQPQSCFAACRGRNPREPVIVRRSQHTHTYYSSAESEAGAPKNRQRK